MGKYDALKIENQFCFPMYVASKEIVRSYTPYLEPLGLTYTQYITMMVLWEKEEMSVKELCEILYLNSGTLTPLLKKLEAKGLITRQRNQNDERSLIVALTKEGKALRDQALQVPKQVRCHIGLEDEEIKTMLMLIYKMMAHSQFQTE